MEDHALYLSVTSHHKKKDGGVVNQKKKQLLAPISDATKNLVILYALTPCPPLNWITFEEKCISINKLH